MSTTPPAAADEWASWRQARGHAVRRQWPRDSLAWLHASFDGFELALACDDPAQAAPLLGEAVAFALACLHGGTLQATATIRLPEGEQRVDCRPCPAHRWRDAILLACVAAQPARLGALARVRPAPASTGGDAWAMAAAEVWLAMVGGDARAASRLDALRLDAASDEERAWVEVQEQLLVGGAPSAALVRLPAIQALAASAWMRGHGHEVSLRTTAMLDALRAAPAPVVHLELPSAIRRLATHPREPAWWLALHGLGGTCTQRVRTVDGDLVADCDDQLAQAGLSLAVRFVLDDAARDPAARSVLDAGELLALADRRARAADATPPSDESARRQQRAALDEAVDLVSTALLRLPPDRAPRADDFPSALGRTIRDAEPGRFHRERLEAVRRTYVDLLRRYDVPASAAPVASDGDATATAEPQRESGLSRRIALEAVEVLRTQLVPQLWAFARDASSGAFDPRPGDYAKVFAPDIADRVRAAYEAMPPGIRRAAPADGGQTELDCHFSPAGMFASDNELSRHFPGGYRHAAAWLDPHRTWARWVFHRPGQAAGMSYDGLVWVDDHWAWFPKAYRVIGELLQGG